MVTPPTEQAGWLLALQSALNEALPRLLACSADPLVEELIEALTAALAEGSLAIPVPSAQHRQALLASGLGQPPDGPLVLEGDQLLWRRWQQQRHQVLDALIALAQTPLPRSKSPAAGPTAGFPASPTAGTPTATSTGPGSGSGSGSGFLDRDQQRAVAAVIEHQLVLLEGGPGTGKTSTVAAMIAAVLADQPSCRIHLTAPTGKATARLRAALGTSNLPCSTLHRLLESRGDRFGRNRRHPLALDLVVVDEVSMVDLPLMQALLDAMPPEGRLVLVGDSAQLPPVGAGAVLLELAEPSRRQQLGAAAIRLQTVYRNNGAIASVAATLVGTNLLEANPVRASLAPAGDRQDSATSLLPPSTAARLAQLSPSDNLRWIEAAPTALPEALLERLRDHQHQLQRRSQGLDLEDGEQAQSLLADLEQLLVLSPLRRGRWGVDAIHRELLADASLRGPEHWPLGTPVLCQRNLADLGLANGDVGLVVSVQGQRRLLFGTPGSREPLLIHPAQLSDGLPALAFTVHKAQGSEANEVWVLMPETSRPSQRLLYTALTRAKQRAVLITPRRGLPTSAAGERVGARQRSS